MPSARATPTTAIEIEQFSHADAELLLRALKKLADGQSSILQAVEEKQPAPVVVRTTEQWSQPAILLQVGAWLIGAIILATVLRIEVRHLRTSVDELKNTMRGMFRRLDRHARQLNFLRGYFARRMSPAEPLDGDDENGANEE